MQGIAQEARYQADSRVKRLESLIRDHLCLIWARRARAGTMSAC